MSSESPDRQSSRFEPVDIARMDAAARRFFVTATTYMTDSPSFGKLQEFCIAGERVAASATGLGMHELRDSEAEVVGHVVHGRLLEAVRLLDERDTRKFPRVGTYLDRTMQPAKEVQS